MESTLHSLEGYRVDAEAENILGCGRKWRNLRVVEDEMLMSQVLVLLHSPDFSSYISPVSLFTPYKMEHSPALLAVFDCFDGVIASCPVTRHCFVRYVNHQPVFSCLCSCSS